MSSQTKTAIDQLIGANIGGWLIESYVNKGKSAAVYQATKDGKQAALKIFDPALLARFGRDVQLKRIERERSLIGKCHPNLVEIYDGGVDGDYFFISMEYFGGPNIAESLASIPAAVIPSIIAQIAAAAKFLEDSSFAHRDIKPENIGISGDCRVAKLLDLGVMRPLHLSTLTDAGDQRLFVGTLQYSPPELLFREEEQTVEGWRAITFYQLGGVLHDLLMKKPLFEEFKEPYGRLVRAVEREVPHINARNADSSLRLLAQNCLAKSPRHRLETVNWDDFARPAVTDPLDSARRRIAQRKVAASQACEPAGAEYDQHVTQYFNLKTSIFSSIVKTITTESLPRYSKLVVSESAPYLVRMVFEPSPRHGLARYFAIYCAGEVLDATAGFQELKMWACESQKREFIPAEPDPSAKPVCVKGALIDQDIRKEIEKYLLVAYAAVLDSGGLNESVRWMNMGEWA